MRRHLPLVAAIAAVGLSGCVPSLYTKGPNVSVDWVAPENSWKVTETPPPENVKCGGYDVGDTLCDFRLQDQFGDEVSLWQFWGDVVLVDISTIWCGPCQELAASTQATFEHFEDDGFMYLTIIQQDVEGNPPKQVDVVEWAEAFGIEAPVLGDGDEVVAAVRQNQFPALLLLDRKMKVHERVTPPDAGVVDAAIEDLLK